MHLYCSNYLLWTHHSLLDITRLILTFMHAYTNVYINQAMSLVSNGHNPRCIACLFLILFTAKLYNHPLFCFGLDITYTMGVVIKFMLNHETKCFEMVSNISNQLSSLGVSEMVVVRHFDFNYTNCVANTKATLGCFFRLGLGLLSWRSRFHMCMEILGMELENGVTNATCKGSIVAFTLVG